MKTAPSLDLLLRQIVENSYKASGTRFQVHMAMYLKKVDSLFPLRQAWGDVDFLPHTANPFHGQPYQSVRFCARVKQISHPYIPEYLASSGISIVDVELDAHGQCHLPCIPIPANDDFHLLKRSLETGCLLEVRGFPATIPIKRSKQWCLQPAMHVHELQEVDTVLQRIQATAEEIAEAEAMLESHPNRLSFVREWLVEQLAIVGIDRFPELKLGLDAAILQSLAFGNVGGNAGRVHSLIIGSPGIGKSLLASAAKLLQPVSSEAQSEKLSIAGIHSATTRTKEGFVSQPGLIPAADGGVFIIQDFHGVKDKQGVLQVLSHVMQEGVLLAGDAAQSKQRARTAVHLDLNRQSDLNPGKAPASELDDIGMKLHTLSRFDFILEIKRDPARQREVDKEKAKHDVIVNDEAVRPDELRSLELRNMKVAIAYLADQHESVVIQAEMNTKIHEAIEKLIAKIEHPILSDFLRRQSDSASKLVTAHARLQGRLHVVDEDLNAVLPILTSKVAFIKNLIQSMEKPDTRTLDLSCTSDRLKWIRREFNDKEFTTRDVHTALQKAGCAVDVRTVNRDLRALSARGIGRNRYSL